MNCLRLDSRVFEHGPGCCSLPCMWRKIGIHQAPTSHQAIVYTNQASVAFTANKRKGAICFGLSSSSARLRSSRSSRQCSIIVGRCTRGSQATLEAYEDSPSMLTISQGPGKYPENCDMLKVVRPLCALASFEVSGSSGDIYSGTVRVYFRYSHDYPGSFSDQHMFDRPSGGAAKANGLNVHHEPPPQRPRVWD